MQNTKEIDGVLQMCGYIAENSSKLVLDIINKTIYIAMRKN